MSLQLLESARFFLEFYSYGKSEFEDSANYLAFLADAFRTGGDEELGAATMKGLEDLIKTASENMK